MKDPRLMGGEELRSELRRADKRLGSEIDRLRIGDAFFAAALDRALSLETETERRKNGGGE